ncbi:MAG: hypothetical protein HY052_06200 [Proteobacteria bacterium]|nr:hypothetical protein [Pseudomonadota bacterium]
MKIAKGKNLCPTPLMHSKKLHGNKILLHSIILAGDYWDNVRQELAKKQKTFDGQGKLLFGLGAKDRPLQHTTTNNRPQFQKL